MVRRACHTKRANSRLSPDHPVRRAILKICVRRLICRLTMLQASLSNGRRRLATAQVNIHGQMQAVRLCSVVGVVTAAGELHEAAVLASAQNSHDPDSAGKGAKNHRTAPSYP
jgi:hypothetical protein